MFRDDRLAVRARVEAARREVARIGARLRDQLAAIAALRAQLVARDLAAGDEVEDDVAPLPDDDLDAMDLAQLVIQAGELEARAVALEARSAELSRVFKSLDARLHGRAGAALELAPPPRPVPLRLVALEALASVWWLLKMTIFFPPAVALPFLGRPAALGTLALLGLVAARRAYRRYVLLARGKVAAIAVLGTSVDIEYTNWPMRIARGWDVRVESFTGHGTRTRLGYTDDAGRQHERVVKGVEYQGGVVLYDPASPGRALGVEAFITTPSPTHDGQWSRGVPTRAIVHAVIGVVYLGVCAAAAVLELTLL